MTWSEKRLWQELRKLDANFRRQAPIGPYFADFATHARKLVIEVDGGVHERLDDVALRDGERQLWLEGEGYTVLRVEDDLEGCLASVRRVLGQPSPDEELRRDIEAWVEDADRRASTPPGSLRPIALPTPPSPALPPSRRKGE
jgi:very-short-patch-repair endonuclease